MTEYELLSHTVALVSDETATPSEPLYNDRLEHGWFSSVRHVNSVSSRPATEQQRRLVREIQLQIVCAALRPISLLRVGMWNRRASAM